MNERIKELSEQAQLPITCEYLIPDEFVRNLSKLIVLECIGEFIRKLPVSVDVAVRADSVRKHFGIET